MRLEEYLTTVTEQIRCTKVREMISEELRNHVLDQAEAYEAEGMFEEEAMEKAIREMGDPVETGISLDRIHRPQLSVLILVLIGVISLASIVLQGILGVFAQEAVGAGYGYLGKHILHILLGYVLMLAVYRLDYSILSRWARQGAMVFLIFVFAGSHYLGITINGARIYIASGPFYVFIPAFMLLYVPLYGGILYSYRGQGYRGIGKALLWALVPTWMTLRIPAFSQGMVLWVTFVVLIVLAVWKGWYQVPRKRTLVLMGVALTAPAWLFIGAGLFGHLATYQMDRVRAFLSNSHGNDYFVNQVKEFLVSSRLVGGNAQSITEIGMLPGFQNDYVFISLITACGVLAGVLVVALLLLLVVKIFRISLGQKNQLGMMLGCGCGIVYLLQVVVSVGMPLGLLPRTSAVMPFFSSGGSGIVVSYILLGLVLSVYRYKNILPAQLPGKAVRSIS